MTRSSGRIASFMLPTAEIEMTHWAPRNRSPQMLARKKDHAPAGEPPHAVSVGGIAERGADLFPLDVGQPLELVQPAAADDADRGVAHGSSARSPPAAGRRRLSRRARPPRRRHARPAPRP